jgi:hypothetical protein
MLQVTLYQYKDENIRVEIQAYFQEESLVVEGYDIGRTVKEFWGDSDYEYSTTIEEAEVRKLYPLMQVEEGNREALLKALAGRFNTNSCYSDFRDFLDKNGIGYKGFSWT